MTDAPLKIIELRAENVKRLKAVEIKPDGTLQVIGGRNAQGKSSVLDAIWLALGGGKAAKETKLPIRDGEEKASVYLDLGQISITRTWTKTGTKLVVQSADGATFPSPQSMLDALLGQVGFDPLAFTRLAPSKQREELLALVDLPVDLDELEQARTLLYGERTEIGRQNKALGEFPEVDDSLPESEISIGALIGEIQDAQEQNRRRANLEERRRRANDAVALAEENVRRAEEVLKAARAEYTKIHDEPLPAEADTSALEDQLASIEETNAAIRANNLRKAVAGKQAELREKYEALSADIAKIDEAKAKALSEAKFPVEGLGFDESGVTYRGVPFSQASSAEQIRVSTAMGMATNPRLRVLMIKDGSLLDAESLAALREQVADGGFQLFIERVGDGDEGAVIIEDGEVA